MTLHFFVVRFDSFSRIPPHCFIGNKRYVPAGTWRRSDVIWTSMQRHHVVSTSIWRHFNGMYMTSKLRHMDVDAPSSRRIDVDATSFRRHVPVGVWNRFYCSIHFCRWKKRHYLNRQSPFRTCCKHSRLLPCYLFPQSSSNIAYNTLNVQMEWQLCRPWSDGYLLAVRF